MNNHPLVIIGTLLFLCLEPFARKAVSMDDPLFIWPAVWIRSHPFNFFGFPVNWFGMTMPMWQANCNPPLTCYWLALTGSLLGWQEVILHQAFFLVAFAAAAGMYQLAKAWCERPLLATVTAIFTPVFFISCTTLMCDVLMLAFLVWAIVIWEGGLKSGKMLPMLAAGLLCGLAVLTKYSALPFLPLLLVLGILRKRKAGFWLPGLAVPMIMLVVFELTTAKLYGEGLFSIAAKYASKNRFAFVNGWEPTLMIGLAFTGGCLLPALFFAPLLWSRWRWTAGGVLIFGILMGMLLLCKKPHPMYLTPGYHSHWGFLLQMALLATAGLHLLLLVAAEWWRRRDTVTTALAFWFFGAFFFAIILNWTISARSLLPMVPAAAILLVRRLDTEKQSPATDFRLLGHLVPSIVVAVLLARADFRQANSARDAALQIAVKCAPSGVQLWFEGHWGFQYYMQNLGAQPVDYTRLEAAPGDLLVVPFNNTNINPPDPDTVELVRVVKFVPSSWVSTMYSDIGAAFYAAEPGSLPFIFGRVPPELYSVFRISKPLKFLLPDAISRKTS